jgi:hypothetical protein
VMRQVTAPMEMMVVVVVVVLLVVVVLMLRPRRMTERAGQAGVREHSDKRPRSAQRGAAGPQGLCVVRTSTGKGLCGQ